MALALVATSEAIATCPRRFAMQQAGPLSLQVLDPPFEATPFAVTVVRRADADAGIAWFAEEVRAATR
jgi:DNA-binding transcriptional LysR family regulator